MIICNFNNKLLVALHGLRNPADMQEKRSLPIRTCKERSLRRPSCCPELSLCFRPSYTNAFPQNLETELQKIILIVDEAHNLPETAISISGSTFHYSL